VTLPSSQHTHPTSFGALKHPGFAPFVALSSMAMLADNVEHVITYWAAFQKFHSPLLGGFAVISHWLPFLLFSMASGALADRKDTRRIIQVGMAIFIGVSLAWGVLIATGRLQVWHAMVLLVLHGIAGVLWLPATQLLLYDIVGAANLQSAVRLNATGRYLGMLVGPAVGSALLLYTGAAPGLLINACIYLPLVLWLWNAPFGPHFRSAAVTPRRALGGFKDVIATVRIIASNRTLVSMILLSGGAALLIGNSYQAQMPQFAQDLGTVKAGVTYMFLLGADAGGALVAGVVLESRGLLRTRPRSAIVLAMLWCASLALFALGHSYLLAIACLFAAGFLELSFNSMSQALIQLNSPNDIRGRVIGVYSMASLGLRTFSGISVGLLGGVVGVHWSLSLSAAMLVMLLGVLWSINRRDPGHSNP
jgi:MFS family permease